MPDSRPDTAERESTLRLDAKWAAVLLNIVIGAVTGYMSASTQVVRLEERLQAEIAMRSAVDTRHDAERAQDRAEIKEQVRELTGLVKEALAERRAR